MGAGWARAGLRLWAALRPLQVSSQPWWEALGDKLPRRGGWKVCPGRWVIVSLLPGAWPAGFSS